MKSIYTLLVLLMLGTSTITSGAKLFDDTSTKDATPNPDSSQVLIAEVPTVKVTPDFAEAFRELKSLSRSERRDRVKEAKKEIKAFKEERKAGKTSTNTLLLVILAILLPPLAVYLHQGVINSKFWIDLLLTLLFFIPGVIYALIVVLGKD